jgi:excisionase family DNA binding protein
MAAYASIQRESSARTSQSSSRREGHAMVPPRSDPSRPGAAELFSSDAWTSAIMAELVDRIAARLAQVVSDQLLADDGPGDEWSDSRHAADYLGVHRDTLRKLAAERAIPSEQDGPGCKLYFRRSDLDAWRRSGGRPRYLASSLTAAA